MTETLLSGDRETVHLFTADLPEDAFWDFVTRDPDTGALPLRDALGVEEFDDSHVEAAMTEDLEGIGLTGFLTEGIGVDEALVAPDRTRLDALTGAVVIVKGAAFDGARVPLHPAPPLNYVGSWHLTAAPSTMEPLSSPVAGTLTGSTGQPGPTGQRNRLSLLLMLAIALILIAGLAIGALA